ncbi:MAG TPA: 3-hydroxyacyl-CoA dehydrogenase NAD-binding domain-containing protein [Puia sp.]|nr:3-hydroxyacyl-CoA dehydrogenase NAD-binding domain-containing protein [Puia sp.]
MQSQSPTTGVSVIGAGTMGNGIAHVFAQKGFAVSLIDSQPQQLEKALKTISGNLDRQISKGLLTEEEKKKALGSITTFNEIGPGAANAWLVVEAATENTELKLNIFRQLDAVAPAGCILATNTSSISITKIASATKRPGSVIGLHFMNPVPVMKLIEVINGYATDAAVTRQMVELAGRLGKTPCVVNDYPGFIANRILMPMINEAIYSLYEGVAGVESIDTIMRLGMAHPMGPLQLADFIGLDVCLSILRVLYEGLGQPKYAPCPLLVNMVTAGRLGVKSGEGFYRYTAGSKDLVVSPRFKTSAGL